MIIFQKIMIWCDNQSANDLVCNLAFHKRINHIELNIHFLRQQTTAELLLVQYVSIECQTTYILTKSLLVVRFNLFKENLSAVDLSKRFVLFVENKEEDNIAEQVSYVVFDASNIIMCSLSKIKCGCVLHRTTFWVEALISFCVDARKLVIVRLL